MDTPCKQPKILTASSVIQQIHLIFLIESSEM